MSERHPVEAREITETQDRAELKRAAHKISWKRMNGSTDVAGNPFADVNPDNIASEGIGGNAMPSRDR